MYADTRTARSDRLEDDVPGSRCALCGSELVPDGSHRCSEPATLEQLLAVPSWAGMLRELRTARPNLYRAMETEFIQARVLGPDAMDAYRRATYEKMIRAYQHGQASMARGISREQAIVEALEQPQ